jgi:ketosteroid isomerase-like protein
MVPSVAEREALFKAFSRAFFKADMSAMYETVTHDFIWASHDGRGGVVRLVGREAIAAHIQRSRERAEIRFSDVAYHHAPEATFMTFRVTETDRATGAVAEQVGIERYTFRDGRIAIKDVYRKPV